MLSKLAKFLSSSAQKRVKSGVSIPTRFFAARHEIWRDDNDSDNIPKVTKRDGTIGAIDKARGFVDYHRNRKFLILHSFFLYY